MEKYSLRTLTLAIMENLLRIDISLFQLFYRKRLFLYNSWRKEITIMITLTTFFFIKPF